MIPFVIGIGLAAAVIIIVVLIIVFTTRQEKTDINKEKYQKRWLAIQREFKRDNRASYQLAILKADKLLDTALKERCFSGRSSMERINSAKKAWQNSEAIVAAHRIRNQIAHEADVNIEYDEARRALASLKQGLKDIGAI